MNPSPARMLGLSILVLSMLSVGACHESGEDVAAVATDFDFDEYLEGFVPEAITHWTASSPAGTGAPPVDGSMLATPYADASRWLHYLGDYGGTRHSPLETLNPDSVSRLEVAWTFGPGVEGQFTVSPIVYGGVMYVTSPHNRLFALDARSGEILWRYDHQQADGIRYCCGPASRGAAIHGDRVFMGTLDARLIAFDRGTGEIDWNASVANPEDAFAITSAPLAIGDRVIIGVAGAEFGVRAFIDAYDPDTGERLWRHYTVPAEGEPGSESWAGRSYETGGASTWAVGAYDAKTDTLFWGTGNPGPPFSGATRSGDNLYSNSIIALDARSGERKWHFQTTPHDIWDWDGNTQIFLAEVERDGESVDVVIQANRNGFYYVLDRNSGEYLRGAQYLDKVNWATLDENGRPVVKESAESGAEAVCPGAHGGMNASWTGAVNPALGLVYVPAVESCSIYVRGEVPEGDHIAGLPFLAGTVEFPEAEVAYAHIMALDLATGERRWDYREESPTMGGVVSTAGGLLFTGNVAGEVLALDSATGEPVWSFRVGSSVRSQPVVYELDGEAYLAIASGGIPIGEAMIVPQGIVPGSNQLTVFKIPRPL